MEEQNNVVIEQPKKSKLPLIIIIVLIIALLSGGGVVAYKKGLFNKKDTTSGTETKIEDKREIDKYIGENEKSITDQEVIKKINQKDDMLDYYIMVLETSANDPDPRIYNEQPVGLGFIIKRLFETKGKTITKENYDNYDYCTCTSNEKAENGDKIYCCFGHPISQMQAISRKDINEEMNRIFGVNSENEFNPITFDYYDGYDYHIDELQTKIMVDGEEYYIRYTSDSKGNPVSSKAQKANTRYTEDDDYYYIYSNVALVVGESTFYGRMCYIYECNDGKQYDWKSLKMTDENSDEFTVVKTRYKKTGNDFYFERIDILTDR